VPARPQGVYPDGRGGWYLKATVGHDPLTGKRTQITKRGYRTVAEAGRARRELQARADSGQVRPSSRVLTVDELLDLYLDDLDADGRLSAKTRFDYRTSTASYVRPLLGSRKVRDLTPEVIISWQRKLLAGSGEERQALAPNTVRLARAPLAGALKLAVSTGLIGVNPMASTPSLRKGRSIPATGRPSRPGSSSPSWRRSRLSPVGVPAGLGAAVGQRRPRKPAGPGGGVRVHARPRPGGLHRQEPRGGADHRARPRPGAGPAGPARSPGGRRPGQRGLLRHSSATLMLANGVPPKVAAERLDHADAQLFAPSGRGSSPSHGSRTMDRSYEREVVLCPPSWHLQLLRFSSGHASQLARRWRMLRAAPRCRPTGSNLGRAARPSRPWRSYVLSPSCTSVRLRSFSYPSRQRTRRIA